MERALSVQPAGSRQQTVFLDLPDEIISRIYGLLPLPDKLRGTRVCRRFSECSMNASVLREIDLAPHTAIDGSGFAKICRKATQATGLSLKGIAFAKQPNALLFMSQLAPSLQRLCLLDCPALNDGNASVLSLCKNLYGLDIINTLNVQRPESYDFIADMQNLAVLRMGGPNITARALEPIGKLPRISALVLLGTAPKPGPFTEPISRARSLTSLVLYVQNLEEVPSLDPLAALSNLERLQFGVTRSLETFNDLRFLHGMARSIRALELSSLLLTPAAVPALAACTGLVELDLTVLCTADSALEPALQRLQRLRSLSLCGVRMPQVASVPALPLLQRARFGFFDEAESTGDAARGMLRQPALRTLELEFTQTTPADLRPLAALTQLETLVIPAAASPARTAGRPLRPEERDWVDDELERLAPKARCMRISRARPAPTSFVAPSVPRPPPE